MDRPSKAIAVIVLVPFLLFSVMCRPGGTTETPEAAAVEQTVRDMLNAYNQGDMEGFLNYWTDDGLTQRFGANRQELMEDREAFLAGPQRVLREISHTSVRAGSGFTEVEIEAGRTVERFRYILNPVGNGWRINAAEQLEPDTRAAKLTVEMDEFAFRYDRAKLEQDEVYFEAVNVGQQRHELALWRLPQDFDLEGALTAFHAGGGELPSGVEVIASTEPLAPGSRGWLQLTDPLDPGTYVMVCLLPDRGDQAGTPHALRGMHSQFSIAAAGGP